MRRKTKTNTLIDELVRQRDTAALVVVLVCLFVRSL